jgi:hypothetical protein
MLDCEKDMMEREMKTVPRMKKPDSDTSGAVMMKRFKT